MNTAVSSHTMEPVTAEELFQMGDIGPCELIDGRIVYMSPTGAEHGYIESNLAYELMTFVRQRQRGRVLTGEVGIIIRRSPDSVRGADIVYVSYKKMPALNVKFLDVAPELVVEIISPSNSWVEMRQKISDYLSIKVKQVWVVEPANRKMLVYSSECDIQEFGENDTFISDEPLKGFTLDMSTLFS